MFNKLFDINRFMNRHIFHCYESETTQIRTVNKVQMAFLDIKYDSKLLAPSFKEKVIRGMIYLQIPVNNLSYFIHRLPTYD